MQAQAIRVIHDVVRTAFRAVLAIFISAPVAGLIAAGATEVIAGVVDHRFFASPVAHAYALGIALIVGYAVALTYAVIECARGVTSLLRWMAQEVTEERPGERLRGAIVSAEPTAKRS